MLPIPPGTHWSDAKPLILPGMDRGSGIGCRVSGEQKKRLPGSTRTPNPQTPAPTATITAGGLRFAAAAVPASDGVKAKPRQPKPKVKNDPRLIAAARELRDRWLERVNATPVLGNGKYDVSRALAADVQPEVKIPQVKILAA